MTSPKTHENNSLECFTCDDDWLVFLEPDRCEKPISMDALAHLLFNIRDALNKGPEGVKAAGDALLKGIRLAYLHTDVHEAALELYMLYLTERLKPLDEPLPLLKGAIERSRAELERVSTLPHERKQGSSRKRKLSPK